MAVRLTGSQVCARLGKNRAVRPRESRQHGKHNRVEIFIDSSSVQTVKFISAAAASASVNQEASYDQYVRLESLTSRQPERDSSAGRLPASARVISCKIHALASVATGTLIRRNASTRQAIRFARYYGTHGGSSRTPPYQSMPIRSSALIARVRCKLPNRAI